MATAQAGQVITKRAIRRLAMAYGPRYPEEHLPTRVEAKTPGEGGQWFCIDCGELPQNNMQADSHEREYPKHRMAWRSFDSGNIEAP